MVANTCQEKQAELALGERCQVEGSFTGLYASGVRYRVEGELTGTLAEPGW